MPELYTCYSPKGDKFELTRPNYLDCIQHYGFTPGPPSGVIPSAPEAEVEAVEASENVEAVADDEPFVAVDEAPAIDFNLMDKDALKDFIRNNFPDAEFDGRASRDTLASLAYELCQSIADAE